METCGLFGMSLMSNYVWLWHSCENLFCEIKDLKGYMKLRATQQTVDNAGKFWYVLPFLNGHHLS